MADLKPRIEKLVGRLAGGERGGTAQAAGGSPSELRPADTGFAEAVARLVAMSLDQYAREGAPIEVSVPWLESTLWFVADEQQAEALVRESVSRGRVWTAREVIALMALPHRTPEIVQSHRLDLRLARTLIRVEQPAFLRSLSRGSSAGPRRATS